MHKFSDAVKMSQTVASALSGRSFCLVMAHDTGNPDGKNQRDFILAPRDMLPCWGELRKYKETHGEKYTLKDDYRPNDLYQPFPEGVPVAVSFRRDQFPASDEIIKEVIKEGPWASVVLRDKFEIDSKTMTISSKDFKVGLRLDSTVLVSLLAFLVSLNEVWYKEIRKYLSVREAVFMMFSQGNKPSMGVNPDNSYYFAKPSPRRVLEGIPNELSSGAFGDGFDYNRERLQDVFSADDPKKSFSLYDYFKGDREIKVTYEHGDWLKPVVTGPVETEEFCRLFKEGLYEALDKEKEIVVDTTEGVAA